MKKRIIAPIAALLVVLALGVFNPTTIAYGKAFLPSNFDAPIAISGDNIYIVWWSNKTGGNHEVLFRASNDGGETFSDKINLSNTTGAESLDAEIAAEGENVIVTWWERNQTVNEPVMRISTDAGETFGSMIMLATNGTIGVTEEGAEAVEEAAAGEGGG
jgi:hypothetical protein